MEDLEEHHLHVHTAWLWSRDKIFDLIKSASKYVIQSSVIAVVYRKCSFLRTKKYSL